MFSSSVVRYLSTKINMSSFQIALLQLGISHDKQLNLKSASLEIKNAAKRGAQIVCLPEFFNSPYGNQYVKKYAEEIPGDTSKLLSEASKENNVYVLGGSFPEVENGKFYNTCLAFNPEGEMVMKYRKTHLFDIDIPGGITFKESEMLSPGNSLGIFETPFAKFGVGICYDLRFPLLAHVYASKGCNMLLYPAAFNMTTGPLHWELLQKARAVDNQLFVATISPPRNENASYVAWGHSTVISPWGDVISKAEHSEETLLVNIDFSLVNQMREQIPVGTQRRDDLFEVVCHVDKKVKI